MEIIVNGQPRQVGDQTTLAQLIQALGLADNPVAAEVNNMLVPKKEHPSCTLGPGDRIELVTLVGGG